MFRHIMPKLILGVAGLVVLAVIILFGIITSTQSAAIETWPSFTMVYRDQSANRGPNNTPGYVVVRLTYKNSRDWQSEILEDSVAPDAAGTRASFSGDVSSGYNARFKRSSSEKYPPTAVLAPDDWLVRGSIARLKAAPASVVSPTSSPGIFELVHTEDVPCVQELMIKALLNCAKPSFQVITRIRYRPEHEIPLNMTVTSDGTLVRQITVSEFAFLP
jgi:hypothetical protein